MSQNQNPDNRRDASWHFDKTIPVSMIVAMVIQFGAAVWFVGKLESRITVLEIAQLTQKERDDRQDRSVGESISLIREDIKEVKSMVARLVDRYDSRSQR